MSIYSSFVSTAVRYVAGILFFILSANLCLAQSSAGAGLCRPGEKRLGCTVIRSKDGSNMVSFVSNNGAADKAGIKKDDEVLRVNGIALSQIPADSIVPFLRAQKDNNNIFDLRRNNTNLTISVTKICLHEYYYTFLSGDCINGQGITALQGGHTLEGRFDDGMLAEGAEYMIDSSGQKILLQQGSFDRNGYLTSGCHRIVFAGKPFYTCCDNRKEGSPWTGTAITYFNTTSGKKLKQEPFLNGKREGTGYMFNNLEGEAISQGNQSMLFRNNEYIPATANTRTSTASNNTGYYDEDSYSAPARKGTCKTCSGTGYVTQTNSYGGNVDMGTSYDPVTGKTVRRVSTGTARTYTSKVTCSDCNGKGRY